MAYTLQQLQSMGATPVNTTPVAKKSYSFDELNKLGATPVTQDSNIQTQDTTAVNKTINSPMQGFTNYTKGVDESYSSGINQIKQGFSQFKDAGVNPLKILESGLTGATGAVNTLLSPIAPLFKPVSDVINKVGDLTSNNPEYQKFANSPSGQFASRIAENINNLAMTAGVVGGGLESISRPKIESKFVGKTSSPIETPKPVIKTPSQINPQVVVELDKLDSQYKQLRQASGVQEDNGLASKVRVADSNVLQGSVDSEGVIRTIQPNGAVDQYTKLTLDNAEQVVRKNLEREASSVSPEEVQVRLEHAIENGNLEGAELKVAKGKIKQEIAGYKLRANPDGSIPLTVIQDAKIAKKANYLDPEKNAYQKAVKNGLATTIEKNAGFDVKAINKELSKYLQDIEFLKRLDGKRVKGSKLGKYFAHISGNIVGGAVGAAIPIPGASAVTSLIGGEVAGRIKSSAMQRTFNGEKPINVPKSPVIENAIQTGKYPRLPSPQSNNLGNLNQQYKPTPIINKSETINQTKISNNANNTAPTIKTSTRTMNDIIPPKKGIVKKIIDKYKNTPNKQGGFVKLGGKTFKEIPEATKNEMAKIVNYLEQPDTLFQTNDAIEKNIAILAKKYNVNENLSNTQVKNAFIKLMDKTKTSQQIHK